MAYCDRQLVYFDEWMDLSGGQRAQALEGVRLVQLSSMGPAEINWQALATAHGHQLRPSTETPEIYYPRGDFFRRCPELLAIASAGAGYDMVDVEACTSAGVLLFNQTGANANSVAQHVLAMMLALSKQLIQSDRAMRSARREWTRWDFNGRELTGRTIGIVGLGNIGSCVAKITGPVFGMRVIAYDPYISDANFLERGAEKCGSLEALFSEADFISVNCPLTNETRGMVNWDLFNVMKKTAYFVITARGGIYDEDALQEALLAKRIAGAGLDVFQQEPPPPDHPLLDFENVIVSPHNAGITDDANLNMVISAIDQWAQVFGGQKPKNLVNPDAWNKFQGRYNELFGSSDAN